MHLGSALDERPIEIVAVERDVDVGLDLFHVIKEAPEETNLKANMK
jgi:hypothetical protein